VRPLVEGVVPLIPCAVPRTPGDEVALVELMEIKIIKTDSSACVQW
jgi:hypothetical protein